MRITKNTRKSVAVFLVDNATMKKLNRESRSKNQVTNVLAFPAPKDFLLPPGVPKTLGEIYLAPDYIEKKGEDPIFLLVHGFLHLLGFDHKGKSDTMKMQKAEKWLLHKLA